MQTFQWQIIIEESANKLELGQTEPGEKALSSHTVRSGLKSESYSLSHTQSRMCLVANRGGVISFKWIGLSFRCVLYFLMHELCKKKKRPDYVGRIVLALFACNKDISQHPAATPSVHVSSISLYYSRDSCIWLHLPFEKNLQSTYFGNYVNFLFFSDDFIQPSSSIISKIKRDNYARCIDC